VVPPLSVPSVDEIDVMRYGAVQLFAARMGATDANFSLDGPVAAAVAASAGGSTVFRSRSNSRHRAPRGSGSKSSPPALTIVFAC
jgi:hypothetical protein